MEDAPVEDAPPEDVPVDDAPAEDAPAEDVPVEDALAEPVEYVMVPVPQELSGAVRAYLARRATRDAIGPVPETICDELAIADALERADQTASSVLVAVARATLEGSAPSIASVAAAFGCSTREIVGFALELNFYVSEAGGPLAVMLPLGPAGPSGRVWDEQVLMMSETTARMVLSAAQQLGALSPET